MKRFLFISPVSDFNTTTEKDFIYEYLTTWSPFQIDTTTEVPDSDTNEIDALLKMIYGIGGFIIFLLVWSVCYYCWMPNISDARSDRIIRRNAESLQARARAAAALARINALGDAQGLSNPNTVQNQVSESSQTAHRNYESCRTVEGHGTRVLNGPPQNEGRFFPQRFQNLFRPNTMAKQVSESRQVTHQNPESHDTTIREQRDYHCSFSSQQNEERNLASQNLGDSLFPETVPKDLCESYTDQKPYVEDNYEVSSLKNPTVQSPPVVERRCQSSPTSPDVRRRLTSIEDTPRLSSSLR